MQSRFFWVYLLNRLHVFLRLLMRPAPKKHTQKLGRDAPVGHDVSSVADSVSRAQHMHPASARVLRDQPTLPKLTATDTLAPHSISTAVWVSVLVL